MKNKVRKSTSRYRTVKKAILHNFYRMPDNQKVVFILGCQRSGTTLISNIFDQIDYAKVYGEFSKVTDESPDKLRLPEIPRLKEYLRKDKAPLVVMKPLVESQNARHLLQGLKGAHGLWVYRDYRDVILSNSEHFKSTAGVNNIRPFVNNESLNWRSQNSSESTKKIIANFFKEDMSPNDAGALFWYARNVLLFEQKLESIDKLSVWKYEDFVASPGKLMGQLLKKLELPNVDEKLFRAISNESVSRAAELDISTEIEDLCEGLMERLNELKS